MEINKTLEDLISNIDISPSDFELARKRYLAVANWLENGDYRSGDSTEIYLQGSFKLGTVIRPYRNSKDADFDIDQVCEIKGNGTSAKELKHDVGDRLNENGDYSYMLDDEGRRCWTLLYCSSEGGTGFHLDILPSKPKSQYTNHINITHKVETNYVWRASNPKDYYHWFKNKNSISLQLLERQKRSIFEDNKGLYESVEEVPKQLIRTPLQRSIQLMKRHRDVYFDKKDNSPISIIITTICAHLYSGQDILELLNKFTEYVTDRFLSVVKDGHLSKDNILDFEDGKWIIKNPSEDEENFADKWHDNPELAEAFFSWIYQLKRDIEAFIKSNNSLDINLATSTGNNASNTYSQIILSRKSSGPVGSDDLFLNLIHQGIEGKESWDRIKKVAKRNVDLETDTHEGKDVAYINYYQVKAHSGLGLTEQEKSHIRNIITKHNNDAAFIFCGNILLGTVTTNMLQKCIDQRGKDVLAWPITRLAKKQIPENSRTIIPVLN
ncbi:MAG: nucleotidyltransferase [Balneolaceae bacterium]